VSLGKFFEPKNPLTGNRKNPENKVTLSADGQHYNVKGRKKPIAVASVKIVSLSGREVDAKDYADRH